MLTLAGWKQPAFFVSTTLPPSHRLFHTIQTRLASKDQRIPHDGR